MDFALEKIDVQAVLELNFGFCIFFKNINFQTATTKKSGNAGILCAKKLVKTISRPARKSQSDVNVRKKNRKSLNIITTAFQINAFARKASFVL